MYVKARLRPEAQFGIIGSTNHRFGMLSIFRQVSA
jgi:hypothetical protein